MRIRAHDERLKSMSSARLELLASMAVCLVSQERLALLLGVGADNVNRWLRPERRDTVEPPFYAINFMRAFVQLPDTTRVRLGRSAPLVDVALVLAKSGAQAATSDERLALFSDGRRELVAMMLACHVKQQKLALLLGIHKVTVNRWVRPERHDAKEPPFHALNFLRAYFLLSEGERIKLGFTAPLIDVAAALAGNGVTFIR